MPRPAFITGGYARTQRGQIHFWECGAGPPVILLAPAPRSARVYRRLLPLLSGFRALAIDTRGFGDSDPPTVNPTMEDYAADVVAVLDSLGMSRAHLFGLHTGNKIAAATAAGWPDRVDRVVLAGRTHSIVADQATRNASVLASMGSPANSKLGRILPKLSALAAQSLDEPAESLLDEVMDEVAGLAGVDSIYAANFAFDLAHALEQLKAPTLIIELVTAETEALGRQAPLLQARMFDCTVLTMNEHERTLLDEHPERIAAPIIAFLSGQGVSGDRP